MNKYETLAMGIAFGTFLGAMFVSLVVMAREPNEWLQHEFEDGWPICLRCAMSKSWATLHPEQSCRPRGAEGDRRAAYEAFVASGSSEGAG